MSKETDKPRPYQLTLVATFDDHPSKEDLLGIIDAVRAVGGVEKAELTSLAPAKRDLTKEM